MDQIWPFHFNRWYGAALNVTDSSPSSPPIWKLSLASNVTTQTQYFQSPYRWLFPSFSHYCLHHPARRCDVHHFPLLTMTTTTTERHGYLRIPAWRKTRRVPSDQLVRHLRKHNTTRQPPATSHTHYFHISLSVTLIQSASRSDCENARIADEVHVCWDGVTKNYMS